MNKFEESYKKIVNSQLFLFLVFFGTLLLARDCYKANLKYAAAVFVLEAFATLCSLVLSIFGHDKKEIPS